MPIYVMLTTLTAEGRKTIKEKPEWIKEVNKEVEAMGLSCWLNMRCSAPMIS